MVNEPIGKPTIQGALEDGGFNPDRESTTDRTTRIQWQRGLMAEFQASGAEDLGLSLKQWLTDRAIRLDKAGSDRPLVAELESCLTRGLDNTPSGQGQGEVGVKATPEQKQGRGK